VLDAIYFRLRTDVPVDVLRDRVLVDTAYVCGPRALKACMYVEYLDPRQPPVGRHSRSPI
jgi:integrase/recombinase XerD